MKRKGKRRKPMDKGTVQQLCFVLGLLLFGALFMVSVKMCIRDRILRE